MMGQTKYIMSGGLAFDEEKDMSKLEQLAREGWIFDRFAFMGYRLRKAETQDIQYSLDYRKDADADYFAYFKEAGWKHEGTAENYIHIFSAPKGTAPIYTDSDSLVEKYSSEKSRMGKGALIMLAATLSIMTALWVISYFSLFSSFEGTVKTVIGVLFVVSLIGLVFTFMPYLGYAYKLNKLK
ncbi:DUF2812 domain-containing protein [Mesobacillus jeotgali]|uniref:DUF2812 domain-containing protein n=1 Tax=Mesobacillus jeotgali TaxID=129985 RepID=A0ABY9VHR3_9BACI|nr:DUF2812 domain-containing protein [Mesobacillus jeotgali]WNF23428.1 DUF2812 domain-containing protein [Mesobacillus jeotgali]